MIRRMVSVTFLFMAGCAFVPIGDQSVRDRFNAKLAEFERHCASGRYNEASCRLIRISPRNFDSADMVRVEGQPLPVPREWVATPQAKLAYSLKLPQPLSEDSGYRQSMTATEYFEHLCAKEAGEFIYRTVDKVEGLYQIRPRSREGQELSAHLYAVEDPYGHYSEGGDQEIYVRPLRYSYLESAMQDWSKTPISLRRKDWDESNYHAPAVDDQIQRFFGGPNSRVRKEFDKLPRSKFGYVWRGVRRPNDRDLGIAGGELIVFDLQTREVLAVRRGFLLAAIDEEPSPSGVLWGAKICPSYNFPGQPGRSKAFDFEYWFIRKVLKPMNLTRPEPYLDVKGN
jgi:hypothetical protein